MKDMNIEEISAQIPRELIARILEVEQAFLQEPENREHRKIAAFDLDNTLLVGDIGEASFIQAKIQEQHSPLRGDKSLIPFTWAQYETLLAENKKKEAFAGQAAALADIPVSEITRITAQVMQSDKTHIQAEGGTVPVPFPNPVMQALVAYLRQCSYEIYVISASQENVVQYVAQEFFNIPPDHVIGMRNVIQEDRLTSQMVEPLTVGDGKADAYHKYIGNEAPLITAGDSTSDLPILKLTHPKGLTIWVGETDEKIPWLKQNTPHPNTIYYLKRQGR